MLPLRSRLLKRNCPASESPAAERVRLEGEGPGPRRASVQEVGLQSSRPGRGGGNFARKGVAGAPEALVHRWEDVRDPPAQAWCGRADLASVVRWTPPPLTLGLLPPSPFP